MGDEFWQHERARICKTLIENRKIKSEPVKQEPGDDGPGVVPGERCVKSETNVKDEERKFPPKAAGLFEFYSGLPHQALVKMTLVKDAKESALLKAVNELKCKVKKFRDLYNRTSKKWNVVRQQHRRRKTTASKPDRFHTGRKNRKLSSWGGITLAIMRAVSQTCAWKVATNFETDASGQSVIRYEHKTAGCLTVSSNDYYQSNECELLREDSNDWQWGIFTTRTDATNKTIVHQEKLQVTVSKAKCNLVTGSGDRKTTQTENFADCLYVREGTGAATHGLVLKQMRSLGSPDWEQEWCKYKEVAHTDETGKFLGMKDGRQKPKYYKWFVNATDAGPDEKSLRQYVLWRLFLIPWCLGLSFDCHFHQLHIIEKNLLLVLDDWISVLGLEGPLSTKHYFSAIATLSNTFREVSSKMRQFWLDTFPGTTRVFAGKLPPRCISGRRLSTNNFHLWFLERTFEKLKVIYGKVLETLPSNKPKANGKSTQPVNETEEVSAEQHRQKLGKWRQLTNNILSCPAFEVRPSEA